MSKRNRWVMAVSTLVLACMVITASAANARSKRMERLPGLPGGALHELARCVDRYDQNAPYHFSIGSISFFRTTANGYAGRSSVEVSPGTTGKVEYVVESLTRNPAGAVGMKLYIDGVLREDITRSFGPRGRFTGRLTGVTFNSVGTHTLRVAVDPSNTLRKKHSCASEYSRTVTVEVR